MTPQERIVVRVLSSGVYYIDRAKSERLAVLDLETKKLSLFGKLPFDTLQFILQDSQRRQGPQ